MSSAGPAVAVGTKFRRTDGDERALWVVLELGQVFMVDVALCECVESDDFVGAIRIFEVGDVERELRLDAIFGGGS